MYYLFNYTIGDTQGHLCPCFDKDSPTCFQLAQKIIQHLVSIYIDPNKIQNTKWNYNQLIIKLEQVFSKFQTTFLYLASKAQILTIYLYIDLYNKLTTQLQRKVIVVIDLLDTYAILATCCLLIDNELYWIFTKEDYQKRFQKLRALVVAPTSLNKLVISTT